MSSSSSSSNFSLIHTLKVLLVIVLASIACVYVYKYVLKYTQDSEIGFVAVDDAGGFSAQPIVPATVASDPDTYYRNLLNNFISANPTLISSDSNPNGTIVNPQLTSVSPDGSLFAVDSGTSPVRTLTIVDAHTYKVISSVSNAEHLQWSPDSQYIQFIKGTVDISDAVGVEDAYLYSLYVQSAASTTLSAPRFKATRMTSYDTNGWAGDTNSNNHTIVYTRLTYKKPFPLKSTGGALESWTNVYNAPTSKVFEYSLK